MEKAFADLFSLPGFTTVGDGAEYAESDSILEGDSDDDEDDVATQSDSHLERIPGRISCFAHTLQLCVKDGLNAPVRHTSSLNKVARIVSHVKKSTILTEKLESLSTKHLYQEMKLVGISR